MSIVEKKFDDETKCTGCGYRYITLYDLEEWLEQEETDYVCADCLIRLLKTTDITIAHEDETVISHERLETLNATVEDLSNSVEDDKLQEKLEQLSELVSSVEA